LIKIRNKRIALLLVLAMLATMFVGIGTTSAASSDNYTKVTVPSIPYVEADTDNQTIGNLTISQYGDFSYLSASPASLKVTVAINTADVTYSSPSGDTTKTKIYNWTDPDFDPLTGLNFGTIDVNDLTTNVTADVTVKGYSAANATGDLLFTDDIQTVTIAKFAVDEIGVSIPSKVPTVGIGADKSGCKVTFTEKSPTTFKSYDEITVAILTSGVTFDDTGSASVTDCHVVNADLNSTDKKLTFTVIDDSSSTKGKVIFTPHFKVGPTASGDITVKISDEEGFIDSDSYVVAHIGTGNGNITVVDGDLDTVYRGQTADFEDVEVKIDPTDTLEQSDYFTVTLPTGVYFQPVSTPIRDNSSDVVFEGTYSDASCAWFTIADDATVDNTFKLTDFQLMADYDAVVGDLNITFGGDLSGTYKIGSVKNAFTITTTPTTLQSGVAAGTGNNIVITETADGSLAATSEVSLWGYFEGLGLFGGSVDFRQRMIDFFGSEYFAGVWVGDYTAGSYFDIVLPAGVTFVGTPKVTVTSGDLDIGTVGVVDGDTLRFTIDESSDVASTITISNLNYSVLNQPALGDIVAQVGADYNVVSNNALESLKISSVVLRPTAVFVIGQPTFTLNGVVTTAVSPSYIKNDRTYLAIRDIGTALGIDPYNILWDAVGQKVTMVKGDKIVQLTIGSNVMYVNGVGIAMDVSPEYGPGDRSFLPAAFLAQAFGATASWDGLTNTVTIK